MPSAWERVAGRRCWAQPWPLRVHFPGLGLQGQPRPLSWEPFSCPDVPVGERRAARAPPLWLCALSRLPSRLCQGPHQGTGWWRSHWILGTVSAHTRRHLLHFAGGAVPPLLLPGRGQVAAEQPPALSSWPSSQPVPRGPKPLLCPNTSVPFCAQGGGLGRGGQDLGWDSGTSARGCKGPGATSQGSRVQGGVGESARKLPCFWWQGASESSGLWGLAPLGGDLTSPRLARRLPRLLLPTPARRGGLAGLARGGSPRPGLAAAWRPGPRAAGAAQTQISMAVAKIGRAHV